MISMQEIVRNPGTLQQWLRAKRAIPKSLGRDEYERLCVEWGVEPVPDTELGGYRDEYGEYWGIPYDAITDADTAYLHGEYACTAETARRKGARGLLRQARWRQIVAESVPRVARARTEPIMVRAGCGCVVEKSLLMSASLGTSCPDCYDRMSDGC